ncbi:MAG: T9SS type A sorting domain-containing protein [Nitrosarchaeum sp.]
MKLIDKNGEIDSLELGYSNVASFGIDTIFGESIFPLNTYKDKICPLAISYENHEINYTTKQIIPLNDGWVEGNAIPIVLPINSLPITLSWDSTLFIDNERDYSLITDWTSGGWFDAGGCSFLENLKDKSEIRIDSITSNYLLNDGMKDYEMFLFFIAFAKFENIAAGLHDNEINYPINIYPTIVTNYFKLGKNANDVLKSISITSMNGKTLMNQDNSFDTIYLDGIPSGMYIISIKLKCGNIYYRKIIKQ